MMMYSLFRKKVYICDSQECKILEILTIPRLIYYIHV